MRSTSWFLVLVIACAGRDPTKPGTALGTFHATATLKDSNCGGNAPNPWEFDLKLAHDARTLYWVQGGLPVQGRVDDSGHFSLAQSTTSQASPADRTHGACLITRTDELAGAIADGGIANGFSGTLGYAFKPSDRSDCASQVGASFAALPCAIHYDLQAVRTIAPDAGN